MLPDYKRLSPAELQRVLDTLLARPRGGNEPAQLLHELSVHELELETQNRELREARRELEEARDRYADLYDFAPVGYLIFDRKGRVVSINLTGARMLGVERSYVVGMPFVARLAPGEGKSFLDHLRTALQASQPVTAELLVRRGGDTLAVRLESAAREITGDTYCRTAMIDISKRKKAEDALRRAYDELDARVQQRTFELQCANRALEAEVVERKRAEEKLRQAAAVFENTDQAIVVMNAACEIVGVNPAFDRIMGYGGEEVVGRSVQMLYSERYDATSLREMCDVVARDGTWQGEVWKRRKNGELFAAWQTIGAVRDDKGKLVNYVSVFADISPLKASEARLMYLAHHDVLTDLPNRLLLDANLGHALEVARRHRHKLAVLFVDLDRFKQMNDRFGHKAGDDVLKEVADGLRRSVRAQDTIARLGGDEFVVVLEEMTRPHDMTVFAEKILSAVRRPMLLDGQRIALSASIGVAVYPDDADAAVDLLKAADAAMYRAKDAGGDTYRFSGFDPASDSVMRG